MLPPHMFFARSGAPFRSTRRAMIRTNPGLSIEVLITSGSPETSTFPLSLLPSSPVRDHARKYGTVGCCPIRSAVMVKVISSPGA